MTAPRQGASDKRVLQEAAEWFAVLHFGDARDEDRARWLAWLGLPGSAQRLAWERVEAINSRFDTAGTLPGRKALHGPAPSRRKALGVLAVLGGSAGAAVWMASRTQAWQAIAADLSASTGEVRESVLPDGTRIWLNTASAIDIRYGDRARRVRLLHGEVHIATAPGIAPDAPPFVLDTRHGRLRPLGTRFTVRQERDGVLLSVAEGAVEVQPSARDASPRVVKAGFGARFSSEGVAEPAPIVGEPHGWTRGVLVVQDIRLDAFLAELGRYRRGRLACDPDVAGLRLSGVYSVRDTDHALAALEHALPVKARRRAPWWVSVEAVRPA